jgi:STE24 endopeptidase
VGPAGAAARASPAVTAAPPAPRRAVAAAAVATALCLLAAVEVTRPAVPPVEALPPSAWLSSAESARAEAFRAPLRWIGVAGLAVRAGVAGGLLAWALRRRAAAPPTRRALLAPALAGAAAWAAVDVAVLPLAAVVWRRSVDAGLSTQDLAGWLRDQAVVLGPTWAGAAVAVAAAVALRRRAPRTWGPLAGLLGGLAGVVLLVASPVLLEPLLLSTDRLPDGPLRDRVLAVAQRAGVDAEVLVGDASRRTTTSNAYVSGIAGTRRIVLYDTLLRDAPEDEVVAVVAHEVAHRAHCDVERAAAQLLAVDLLAGTAVQVLLDRRGGAGRPAAPRDAVAAVALVLLLAVAVVPVERWSSRRGESAADARAVALTGDPDGYAAMLRGLARRNLADPAPPTWAAALGTHPPTGERLARAGAMP